MNIPAELKYTKDHEWVRVEGDVAVVGVTDYAQGELGDIVYIEIETEGDNLDQEEVFGTVEAVKTVSDLFMPISGEIVEVNSSLFEQILITVFPVLRHCDPLSGFSSSFSMDPSVAALGRQFDCRL